MQERNPALVFVTISGFGTTGPYKDMPEPRDRVRHLGRGRARRARRRGLHVPRRSRLGRHQDGAGVGRTRRGVRAAAREDDRGQGARLDIAQTDAAAAVNWLKIEGFRAYERPEDEVTGNASDNYERREPGVAGMKEGVRYQVYESSDGYILFMASEREFWENFCDGIEPPRAVRRASGREVRRPRPRQHALRRELWRHLPHGRSDAGLGAVRRRRQRADRTRPRPRRRSPTTRSSRIRFPWLPAAEHGTDLLPNPIKFVDEGLASPRKAPTPGQHTDEVLRELGLDASRIAALRSPASLARSAPAEQG